MSKKKKPSHFLRSPLKWPGGKTVILNQLVPLFNEHHKFYLNSTFFDVFGGSAVVCMNAPHKNKVVNDINSHLVNFYRVVKEHPIGLLQACARLFKPENVCVAQYNVLKHRFNQGVENKIESAALFLWLNKHCFNGLVRFNSKGLFNAAPHSCCKTDNKKPTAPEAEILELSVKLKDATIYNQGFEFVIGKAQPGDLLYCDPPYFGYDGKHEGKSSFVNYSKDGFGVLDQIRLANLAAEKAKEGITTIISNHATNTAFNLYKELGAKIRFIQVRRSIGCTVESRESVRELLAIFEGK